MGSYLTIVNSTNQTYACNVGTHEFVWSKVFGIFGGLSLGMTIINGIGTIALLVSKLVIPVAASAFRATMLVTTLWAFNTAFGLYSAHFLNVQEPIFLKSIQLLMQQYDSFNETTVKFLRVELEKNNFVSIGPMQSHQYGKMALGLLRQATCIRPILLSNTVMKLEGMVIEPIWSSLKPGQTRMYDMMSMLRDKKVTIQNISVYSGKHAIVQKPGTQPQPSTLIYTTQQVTLPLESTTTNIATLPNSTIVQPPPQPILSAPIASQ